LLASTAAARRGTADQLLNPSDTDRFVKTIEAIPAGARTVLDAGCGLGVLTDTLAALGYDAHGIDLDPDAMTEMRAAHDVGSIAALPYADASFDVVIANEVLEHLPVDVYAAALPELGRVAAQAVVVTVPNAESLESASTVCPMCRATYSIHGHVRSFQRERMGGLIPGFRLARLGTAGPFKVRHRTVEWYLRRRLLGHWPARAGAVCPQCGFRQPGAPASTELGRGGGVLGRTARLAVGFPWQRWWFVAAYEAEANARS
jgi:SAM-dependent methyltransferase